MRLLKPHAPYCIYRKLTKAGYFWYVRYWDEAGRKYTCIRATGIPGKKLTAEEMKPPEGYVNEQRRRNLTFHGL
ncbi:MAG: hypothetical protein LBF78_07225, partial [Treponema sp.]|nr:hypothetical protein [Treponema sp.]